MSSILKPHLHNDQNIWLLQDQGLETTRDFRVLPRESATCCPSHHTPILCSHSFLPGSASGRCVTASTRDPVPVISPRGSVSFSWSFPLYVILVYSSGDTDDHSYSILLVSGSFHCGKKYLPTNTEPPWRPPGRAELQ